MFPISHNTLVCETTNTVIRIDVIVLHIFFFSVAHMSTVAVISALIRVRTYISTVAGNEILQDNIFAILMVYSEITRNFSVETSLIMIETAHWTMIKCNCLNNRNSVISIVYCQILSQLFKVL